MDASGYRHNNPFLTLYEPFPRRKEHNQSYLRRNEVPQSTPKATCSLKKEGGRVYHGALFGATARQPQYQNSVPKVVHLFDECDDDNVSVLGVELYDATGANEPNPVEVYLQSRREIALFQDDDEEEDDEEENIDPNDQVENVKQVTNTNVKKKTLFGRLQRGVAANKPYAIHYHQGRFLYEI